MIVASSGRLYHSGIKGMKWGVRRYQNPDGTWTEAGKKRYSDYNPTNAFERRTAKRITQLDVFAKDAYARAEKLKAKGKTDKAEKYTKHGNILSKKAAKEEQVFKKYRELSEDAQKRINKQTHRTNAFNLLKSMFVPLQGGIIGGAIQGVLSMETDLLPNDEPRDKVDKLVKRYIDVDISDLLKQDA